MVIFQRPMFDIYFNIFVYIILALVFIALVIYFDFILFKRGELPGIYIMYKIIPTLILALGIYHFSTTAFAGIRYVYLWNNDKYFSAQGEIKELVSEEVWLRDGSNEPHYECSFVIDGVKFPLSLDYTVKEAASLKKAYENKSIVKVSYMLESGVPFPAKIETVETEGEQADDSPPLENNTSIVK